MARMGRIVLLSIMLLNVHADDFFFPNEEVEEMEDLDEEVEFPGGDTAVVGGGGYRPPSDRQPFTIQVYDTAKLRWRQPSSPEEHDKYFKKQLEEAWRSAVFLDLDEAMSSANHHTSKQVSNRNLYHFYSKFLNPSDEPMTGEEEVLLTDSVQKLRLNEGLVDDNSKVAFGFLSRGSPREHLDQLMAELKHMRDTTGERRLAEEIQANRERPLLQRRAAEKVAADLRAKEEKEALERAAQEKLMKEDRETKRKRLAEKAALKMKEAEAKRQASQS